jgi:adenine-specific DNA-methyltransferase
MDEKPDGLSPDIAAAEREKLRAVFPQCFVDGKPDERKLPELLGIFDALDENDREKYEFRRKGKQEAFMLAGKRSAGTLRPVPEDSVDWENTRNIYIEGDNLEVLKLLQTSYYRKVKMIYIDPPYNTGNDFVYADDFADPLARYREITRQTTKSNPESMGRFHTNRLNMMLPRLRLAANLLRDDGVIFISIDDGEVHNLRKLCDEIFGEENHLGTFIWKRRQMVDSRTKTGISEDHEYLLCYSKFGGKIRGKSPDMSKYSNPDNDPNGDWMSADMIGLATASQRPNLHYDLTNPATGITYSCPPIGWRYEKSRMQELVSNGEVIFPKEVTGRPRRKKYVKDLTGDFAGFSTIPDTVFNTRATRELRTLFDENEYFDFPKPVDLIKLFVEQGATPTEDDEPPIVLDFFSGSATTAHAVMQLNAEDGGNRRFILVQLPEICDEKSEAAKAGYVNICEIGKERIRRAGAKLAYAFRIEKPIHAKEEWTGKEGRIRTFEYPNAMVTYKDANGVTISAVRNETQTLVEKEGVHYRLEHRDVTETERFGGEPLCDMGFRVFRLDSSNLKLWDDTPITGENAAEEFTQRMMGMLEILKPDRSDLDVVYEVMLKLGQDLCEPIVAIDLPNDRQVYGVGADIKFIVCLTQHITAEDAALMADCAPGRIVFADQCFDNSEAKSNVKLTLRDKGIGIRVL